MNSDDTTVEQLVAEALERMEHDETVDVAALCKEHPELAPAVEAALKRYDNLASIHRAANALDPMLGQTLNERYRLEERIGAGAMGVVYRGTDTELCRSVAVKLLRSDFVADPRLEERFGREAEALARIRHNAVVTVHDRGRSADGRAFLVLELLAGETAAAILANPERGNARIESWRSWFDTAQLADTDVRQCVRWIAEAAAGLTAAHDANVVHRDIKPSNLFFERNGNAVLLDFGIVSLASDEQLTATGSSLGTPAYMAPEQLDSRSQADTTADIYGLGATLYHLLTGEAPFRGTPQQVLAAVGRMEPAPADRRRPGLPNDLVAVVEKAMAKRPHQRYPSAATFRNDLLAWLDSRPVTARRITATERTWRRLRRSPKTQGILATLLTVLAIASGWQIADARATARSETHAATLARVPPTLLMSSRQYRDTSAVTSSERVRSLLDQLVATADEPCPAYAIRALHHLDRGALELAAVDFATIAASGNAPMATWLAAECRAGRAPDIGADPTAAPEPSSAPDRYTAALLAFRSHQPNGRFAWKTLREIEDVEQRLGYAELLLIAEMVGYDPEHHGAVNAHFRSLERRCKRLTADRGRPMATTLHVESVALLVQSKLMEARETVESAMELAPEDSALQIHRGTIALRSNDYSAGITVLERAIELQPRSVMAHELLTLCTLYSGDPDAAERVLANTPFEHDKNPEARRAVQEGRLAYYRAVEPLRHDPNAKVDQVATRRALEAFRRAAAAGRKLTLEALACELLFDDPGESRPELIERAITSTTRQPTNPQWLRNLAVLLNGSLTEAQTLAIQRLLLAQAQQLLARDQ